VPVAFEQTDIIRVQAGIFSGNLASMRVLEKWGFSREAVHHNVITKRGIVIDEVMYVQFRKKRVRRAAHGCRKSR
jgi:RimJ/RimL family protein N-acetyltransferase